MTACLTRSTPVRPTSKSEAIPSKSGAKRASSREIGSFSSSGARRLHLLTRPFGNEYTPFMATRRKQRSQSASPALKKPIGKKYNREAGPPETSASQPSSSASPLNDAIEDMSISIHSTKKRSLRGLRYTPGVRTTGAWHDAYHRVKLFDQVWKEQQLGTHLDPSTLADKVVEMRLYGVNAKTAGRLTQEVVEAKADPLYEVQYQARAKELTEYYTREAKALAQDPYLSKGKSEKDRIKTILNATFKRAEVAKAKRQKQEGNNVVPKDGPLAKNPKVHAIIEKVGDHVKEQLQKEREDFNTLPLAQLEERARSMRLPGIEPAQFSKHFWRYVKVRRGEGKWDLEAAKKTRKASIDREAKRLKRNKGKRQA